MARPTRRLIRILAASAAALLLLAVAAVAALLLFVDADRFRPRIERAASQSLGREVSLGRLHWDPGSRIALASEGGAIANAPGFDVAQFASWRRISFGLGLWPLLRRDVRIDHLAIDGLVLDLQRNADGNANWTLVPAVSPGTTATIPPPATGKGGLRIALDSLALTDATIRYRDAIAGRDLSISATDLSVSLPPDLAAPQLVFADVELNARMQDWPLSLQAAVLRVDRNGPVLELPEFEAHFDQTSVGGLLRAHAGEAPGMEAQLHLSVPSVRTQLERLGRPLGPMQDPAVPGAATLDVRLRYSEGAARMDELLLTVDDTTLKGHVELPSLRPLVLRFELDADQVNIDRYLEPDDVKSAPFELPVRALRSLDAKGTLRVTEAEASGAVARQAVFTVE
jgi:AsmA protein